MGAVLVWPRVVADTPFASSQYWGRDEQRET